MKTITDKATGASIYIFENNINLDISAQQITVGDPVEFTIIDFNSSNTIIYENVDPPDDWKGYKYLYDGTTWAANENFTPSPAFDAPHDGKFYKWNEDTQAWDEKT